MSNILNEKWIVIDGSIYLATPKNVRSEFQGNKTTIKVNQSVAFNLGKEVADYIVSLHNANIDKKVA